MRVTYRAVVAVQRRKGEVDLEFHDISHSLVNLGEGSVALPAYRKASLTEIARLSFVSRFVRLFLVTNTEEQQ